MTDLPEPLTPADCDLTDFQYMELDVRKLRDSRFAAQVSGDGFRAAVLLWAAAWHQVPAGSLPDDDLELANLAGYGRFIKEWKKVRDEALYGFVKCRDGRLYHQTIAEKARAAWQGRLEYAYDKLVDRLRKENKKRAAEGREAVEVPDFETWNVARLTGIPAERAATSKGIPAESKDDSSGIPTENALRGRGNGEGEDINPAASPAHDAPARVRDPRDRFQIEADWQPSPNFPAQLVMAGIVPENLLTVSNLAEFVSYWRADGAAKTHAQWEHALLKNLIAIRDRASGGTRHAAQNRPRNSQRLTPFERVVAANPLGGRSPGAPAAGGRVFDAEPD